MLSVLVVVGKGSLKKTKKKKGKNDHWGSVMASLWLFAHTFCSDWIHTEKHKFVMLCSKCSIVTVMATSLFIA